MDVANLLPKIISSGKVEFGTRKVISTLLNERAKAVIISSNCPKSRKEDIKYYAKIGNITVIEYSGTSLQLGELCSKPFIVSAVSILDTGLVPIKELKVGK